MERKNQTQKIWKNRDLNVWVEKRVPHFSQ